MAIKADAGCKTQDTGWTQRRLGRTPPIKNANAEAGSTCVIQRQSPAATPDLRGAGGGDEAPELNTLPFQASFLDLLEVKRLIFEP